MGATPWRFESSHPHQKWIKSEIVARKGGFFFGFAEQKPDVFRGGETFWAAIGCAFLVFRPPLAVFDIIQMHTNQIDRSFSLALIAVLYKLDLSDLCATGRLFKLRGCYAKRKILFIR